MRPSNIILPLLLSGFLACTSNQEPPQPISAPTLEKGESFFNNNNNDSAFYYFNLVATGATDSLEIAMAYTYMGIIQAYEGDHYGGQESLLKSLTYLDEHKKEDQECLSSIYHELGNICLNLKNYDAAIDYYRKALKYIKHPKARTIALNSIALTYQKKGDYDQAIDLYKSLLAESKNKKEYARVLSNYAKTKWLKNAAYSAGPELQRALQIRKDSNDIRGLNASYAHLSDYYSLSLPDSALHYAVRRYEIAREMNSPDDEVEALSKLITLSPTNLLKPYFIRYQHLTDSIQTAKNAAKNQFALIRYEAAKNKADNLQLQKDNAQKKTQLVVQRFILALTILLFIIAGIALILRYRRRRQQIEFASRQAIQEYQLKTSQKVHDVVANGLYRIMTELEHKASVDQEELIDKIEVLYEQSRDISYENPTISKIPFHVKIDNLLESFGSEQIKVLIFGNGPMLWSRISVQAQHEVEYILQELMINMKKHSQANSVMIKFECQNNQLQILYTDDGIGISPQVKYGNGLQNTGNRIKRIDGQYTFEHPAKGLKIHISIPIAQSL